MVTLAGLLCADGPVDLTLVMLAGLTERRIGVPRR
jgi:hypothetical protein